VTAPSSPTERPLDAKLSLVRDVLGMDVAMITEIRDEREIARYAAGEWPGVGNLEGAAIALEDTFCRKLMDGEIPNWIGDVVHDERVADLRMAQGLGVGAWIGALLRGPGGRRYVLCALARDARPELGQGELHVLEAFVHSLLPHLAAAEWPAV
jgi:hypothetical protein